jgi:hypothetical protein
MMSTSHGLHAAVSVASLSLILASPGCAHASWEEWKTTISCDGAQYVVTSYCRASVDRFELNSCREGQKLANSSSSIAIPASPRKAKQPLLFATHWQCVKTHVGSYLLLDFSSGSGRTANDESTEIYDNQLRRVIDESITRAVYKHLEKAAEGYVKSIYPSGDN